ncbi:MAG: Na+/H+ antiporter NhaA [Myxococcales bacterium]|nr:Na+/H+ antiporter NhaA [Myxococcales bacterium]
MRGAVRFLLENSLFLILGALAALAWANLGHESYEHFLHLELFHNDWVGHPHGEHRSFTLHFLVNDMLMAMFFAIAGKEVWEATLPGGPLSNPKQAAAPLIATFGGMAGPVGVYLVVALALGQMDELGNGWAVPTATDIAFSYLVARFIFGAAHPAIPFLLLLAIADDALGLVIIAIFYPQGPIELQYMLLPVAAIAIGIMFNRKGVVSFWPYLLVAGTISWLGFHWANLHPALGLLPIIPTMPHAHSDSGLFAWDEWNKTDTLNSFEHWWKNPVELILGAFGLMNAGVAVTAVGGATWAVMLGLLIGKPLGIFLLATIAGLMGFTLPKGMSRGDLFVVGCAAAIGFTVAIFVASVAFPPGSTQDAAKIGALGSFGAAIITFIAAKVMGVVKVEGGLSTDGHSGH